MVAPIYIILLFCASAALAATKEKVLLCYWGSGATNRPGDGKFDVENIDAKLCTHLVYAFAGLSDEGKLISLDPALDLPDNNGQNYYGKFNALKKKNKNLKTILSVGGWNEGSAKYSTMAGNSTLRQTFVQSSLETLLKYNFNGLDMDWEYPARRDTVLGNDDINNFTQLLKELREAFDKYGLLLTAAVSSVEVSASLSYDIPAISKYLHYVNVMTYDLHGSWDSVTGHNAALHAGDFDQGKDPSTLFTVDVAVKYWLDSGCPAEKLLMGAPLYGRTFTLTNPAQNSVGAPASGPGPAGPFTGEAGILAYNEICLSLRRNSTSWTIKNDKKAKVPYAYSGSTWITYDNPTSIADKVKFAIKNKLAGAMVWSIESDDFHNRCGQGRFPLLKTMKSLLKI